MATSGDFTLAIDTLDGEQINRYRPMLRSSPNGGAETDQG
jgi:hypothetical protein